MPPICWSGNLIFTLNKLEALVAAAKEWKETVMTSDESALLGFNQNPMDGSQVREAYFVVYGLDHADGTGHHAHGMPPWSRGNRQEAVQAVLRCR